MGDWGVVMRTIAWAKVNLTLAVAPRADDGYHPLRSIFLRIGLADELSVEQVAGDADELRVDGLPGCPVDGNLVLRAFELIRAEVAVALPALSAQLHKQVPIGAGLGGGSSDGAAALELALATWGIGLPAARVEELALELGADVPFFLADTPAALVEGRGERIVALPAVRAGAGVLLATFAAPLSTAAVFAAFDGLSVDTAPASVATDELADALAAGLDGARLADRAAELRDANSLWPAAVALAPELGSARDALESATDMPWLLTGSGRSLFSLHRSPEAAVDVGRSLAAGPAGETSDVVFYAVGLDGASPAWRST
ncbi:MAG TPA: hypothetical protein VH741_11805 [Candidatus Limnocylindrales bacterium]